jgi:hypothetical protein
MQGRPPCALAAETHNRKIMTRMRRIVEIEEFRNACSEFPEIAMVPVCLADSAELTRTALT